MSNHVSTHSAFRHNDVTELFPKGKVALILLFIVVVAGGLRFFRLGEFPFSGDETATLAETDSFARSIEGPIVSPTDRLPRLIPLAYLIHLTDYHLFGRDEFGARVMMAICGTVSTAVVGFGLIKPMGYLTAISAALLIAVWPEHLFQSQQNRFYITAWLLSASCIVAGANALKEKSSTWTIVACLLAIAAMLTHSIQLMLLPGLLATFIATAVFQRHLVSRTMLAVILLALVVAITILAIHFVRIGQNWNIGEKWGYSSVRSLQASILQIGWPIALLSGLGGLLIWRDRNPLAVYWISWALIWLVASAALPLFVVYHPGYVFPLSLSVLVLAGYGIARIGTALSPSAKIVPAIWVVIAACLQLPSTVSYFIDGSRHDFRTPAQFINQHWQAHDRIASISPKLLKYYLPAGRPVTNLYGDDPEKTLNNLIHSPGRVWVVLPAGRAGFDEKLKRWVDKHAVPELIVKKNRFDYYDFTVGVFLANDPRKPMPR